jgi:hypothetical protein
LSRWKPSQDPRMMQVMGVLMGINIQTGDQFNDSMNAQKPAAPKPKQPEPEPEPEPEPMLTEDEKAEKEAKVRLPTNGSRAPCVKQAAAHAVRAAHGRGGGPFKCSNLRVGDTAVPSASPPEHEEMLLLQRHRRAGRKAIHRGPFTCLWVSCLDIVHQYGRQGRRQMCCSSRVGHTDCSLNQSHHSHSAQP